MGSNRKPRQVIHRGPAAFGEPTEPGRCPGCGERPGTVQVTNFMAVPGGQVPVPRPDVWVCLPCMQGAIRQGVSQRAADWQASIDAESDDARRAQLLRQAATVAASIRSQLGAVQAEPDESTAAFLRRYGA